MQAAVQDRATILERLNKSRTEIRAFGVRQLGLFGSFVKDTAVNESDVDLLVEFEQGKKTYDNFMGLSLFLEELLGRNVELVTLQSLNKYIGQHILNEVQHVYR
ncbi:MAG TPA: nucleotidyltransferase family protein [Flavipsychrobacter sp.]|nr:nucleotidyltransferase family protein [Flavipsychrobacter sp.]